MSGLFEKIHALRKADSFGLSLLGGVACGLSFVVMGLVIMAWRMSFDEFLHVHYLWLTSIGRIPHVDFWCHYPALGYVLMQPFFGLLPESVYSVIALRFFNLALFAGIAAVLALHARHLKAHWIWGAVPLALVISFHYAPWVVEFRTDGLAALPAVLALSLMLREPRPLRGAFAAGLSALSVLIMPKYLYPLAFANIAYAASGFRAAANRRAFLMAIPAGAVAAVVLAQLFLLFAHVWLWDDLYWSPILMQKYFLHCMKTEPSLASFTQNLLAYFSTHWWVAILMAAGVAGLAASEARRKGVALWVGVALLAGVAFSWFLGSWPFAQYLIPGLYCLALFIPYAPRLLRKPWLVTAAGLLLTCLALWMNVDAIRQVTTQLGPSPMPTDLYGWESLLRAIPRGERVVGFFGTHPCLREDQTFVTWDERWGNPRGFTAIMPQNSRVASYFQPGYFAQSLQQSPPAAVAFNANNYPPGWNDVLANFLQTHADRYVKITVSGEEIFLRRDLVPSQAGASR